MEPSAAHISGTSAAVESSPRGRIQPLVFLVVTLFFAWGFATVLIDSLIPKLKGMFSLNYAEVMLTQFAFFLAYFVVSIPAGLLLARIGYIRGIVVGLAIMAVGALMIAPAAHLGVFPGFLVALFVMASGITLLQVAANPLIAVLGRPEKSHSRLTLAQAFNSFATFVGPLVGAAVILKSGVAPGAGLSGEALAAIRRTEAQYIQLPFLGIAAGAALLAVIFWTMRRSAGLPSSAGTATRLSSLALLSRPRLALGALSIFLYVGAEVSIGSVMVNYLMQPGVLHAPAARASQLVAFYWGGAMVGRFIGSAALRWTPAGLALAVCAVAAALLASASALSVGLVAAVAIIAVGLFNSIMFPTIFTLAIEDLGEETPQGSGILCLSIVGGAVIPLVTGLTADRVGLSTALFVPVACYLLIALYGLKSWKGFRGPPIPSGVSR